MSEEGLCGERAGFLFTHACVQIAAYRCGECSKEICAGHCQVDEAGRDLCTSCAKRSGKAVGKAAEEGTQERTINRAHGRDDPYFYGHRHYDGWASYGAGYWGYHHHSSHRDRHDFNEGDGAALAHEGDEGFENDFDAS